MSLYEEEILLHAGGVGVEARPSDVCPTNSWEFESTAKVSAPVNFASFSPAMTASYYAALLVSLECQLDIHS